MYFLTRRSCLHPIGYISVQNQNLYCRQIVFLGDKQKKASDKFYRTLWRWPYAAYLKYGIPRNDTLRPVCKIETRHFDNDL